MATERVLLVDDDPLVRQSLERMLAGAGYQVTAVENGKAALAAVHAATEPFALILTDIIMPGMDGVETIMEIRRSQAGARIVAMSGGGRLRSEDLLEMARKLGAAATINKPFRQHELLAKLRDVLEGREGGG